MTSACLLVNIPCLYVVTTDEHSRTRGISLAVPTTYPSALRRWSAEGYTWSLEAPHLSPPPMLQGHGHGSQKNNHYHIRDNHANTLRCPAVFHGCHRGSLTIQPPAPVGAAATSSMWCCYRSTRGASCPLWCFAGPGDCVLVLALSG